MMEKHMTPEMDLEGNHKMDWFFNEYVYGTALPSYKFNEPGLSENTSVEQKVPLKGLKDTPKRAMLSYYDDVLAAPN
jgi:hypothetical protein